MTEDASLLPTTYLIVGAGPSGLTAGRALRRQGIDFEIVERHNAIGGIWDIENPGSPMYETCHFITSTVLGGFVDYPFPADYPMYPKWYLILEYIRAMARDYGLEQFIHFNTSVVRAEPQKRSGTTVWSVTFDSGQSRLYRGVIYAAGQQWYPFRPSFEGEDDFKGEIYTGNKYKSPREFAGKRVVVVGAGNSGVDIAVDAAEFADKAFLSTRRGYHFLPKQVFGVPTPDLFDGKAQLPDMPGIPKGMTQQQMIDLALATIGDLKNYGLPEPEGVLGSTQPIVSDLILHYFSHGLVRHRPNIRRFHEHSVEFEDGRIEDVDLVLFATGYDIQIPWLPDGAVRYQDGHAMFHLGGLSLETPGLYAINVLHPTRADAWTLFDQLTQIVVADIVAELTGEGRETMEFLRNEYRPDLKGDFPFLKVRRNVNQVDTAALNRMLRELESTCGIEMPHHETPGFYDSVRVASVSV